MVCFCGGFRNDVIIEWRLTRNIWMFLRKWFNKNFAVIIGFENAVLQIQVLRFKASIGVLIQREPKDFHCLTVLNTQFSIQKYIVVLENLAKINRVSGKIIQSRYRNVAEHWQNGRRIVTKQ